MSTVAFDTLAAVKRLKEAGVSETQAEAIVETFGGALNDNVATKGDLRELEQRMNARFESLEQRMTIRLCSIMIAGIGFLVILDRLFPVAGP